MSTSPYGAFQPITDLAQRWGDRAQNIMGATSLRDLFQALTGSAAPSIIPTAQSRPGDTSWHDQMVRQANQSFRDQTEQPHSVFALKKGK